MNKEVPSPREALPKHRRTLTQLARILNAAGEASELPLSPVYTGTYVTTKITPYLDMLPIKRDKLDVKDGARYVETFDMRDQRTIIEHMISVWPSRVVARKNLPAELRKILKTARERWLTEAKTRIVSSEFLD